MKYALALVWALPAWGCVALDGDRILGKDLAAAKAEFATVEATAEIGFAPRPGVTRVLPPAELVALARKYGVVLTGIMGSACFVRAAQAAGPAVQKVAMPAADIQRGDKVAVEVTSGAALVRFQAAAESAGRVGDSVLIRNPENGKLFQARVEGKGRVVVQK
jgi:hypothetical protein